MAGLFGNLTGHSSAGLSSPLDAEDARDAWHRFYGDPSTGAAAEDPKVRFGKNANNRDEMRAMANMRGPTK